MECIWVLIFEWFWSILGAKLGCKIEQKSIKNSIEKTIEKRRAVGWPTRPSKSLRLRRTAAPRAQGEGVGGEVNLSLDSKNNIETYTAR